MNIEKQVCSFEQAKRFAELKVGEDYFPLYVWVPPFPVFNDTLKLCPFIEFEHRLKNSILSDDAKTLVGFYPAFTVSELGVMLPEYIKVSGEEFQLTKWGVPSSITGTSLSFGMQYRVEPKQATTQTIPVNCLFSETEAGCRAKMLIHLLESEILSAETCNKRLVE